MNELYNKINLLFQIPIACDSYLHTVGELDGTTFVLVDGDLVKITQDMDFTEGGNGFRFDFIPKDEIWIDKDFDCLEWTFVAFHEFVERSLMSRGMSYEKAHDVANVLEREVRVERGTLRGV